ncbi:MAG: polyprenyl synthetase family protein [Burkholderiales bacterium]|nr:polyprenyl synthetase family protein [Burkholderiales bacterium]
MSQAFHTWMKNKQLECEIALANLLPQITVLPERLHEAMRYAAMDGGKRVRPLLVFAAGHLFNAPADMLLRAACAVELIHAYSLVHDDMPCMDDDALRRGKPTVHIKYDEATALLVGDALQAQAFQVLSEGDGDAVAKLSMVRLLAQASGSVGMCGGQAIDLASVGLALDRIQLEQMHRLKTGALLRASVLLGAMSGKKLDEKELQALDAYAAAIGLAFQVVDDVLDATADSATLGKTAGKDAADNKPTYVSLLGLSASKQLAEQLRCDAHDAVEVFGNQAQLLRDLADLVVQRQA